MASKRLQFVGDTIDLLLRDLQLQFLILTDVEPAVAGRDRYRTLFVRAENERRVVLHLVAVGAHAANRRRRLGDHRAEVRFDGLGVDEHVRVDLVDKRDQGLLQPAVELTAQLGRPLLHSVVPSKQRAQDVVEEDALAGSFGPMQHPRRQRLAALLPDNGEPVDEVLLNFARPDGAVQHPLDCWKSALLVLFSNTHVFSGNECIDHLGCLIDDDRVLGIEGKMPLRDESSEG